jgi:hypothetical protein
MTTLFDFWTHFRSNMTMLIRLPSYVSIYIRARREPRQVVPGFVPQAAGALEVVSHPQTKCPTISAFADSSHAFQVAVYYCGSEGLFLRFLRSYFMKISLGFQRALALSAIAFFLLVFSFRSEGLQFSTSANYNVGTNAQLIVTGDVNNDGKLDLLVFTSITLEEYYSDPTARYWLHVLTNAGNGTFSLANKCHIDFSARSLCIGQFDGDTNLDVVMQVSAYTNGHSFSALNFLHGNGDATFTQSTIPIPDVGGEPIATDFNLDGKLDLAFCFNALRIFLGAGNGSFSVAAPLFAYDSFNPCASADFNSDGKPDLVMGANGALKVVMGVGDGTFTNEIRYPRPNSVYYENAATGDFNGDGKPDLALCDPSSHLFSVRLNKGNGTFETNTDYTMPPGAALIGSSFGIADFDLDGKQDVAVNSGRLMIFPGNGNGTFGSPYTNFANPANVFGGGQIALGDFDGDGRPDLAYMQGASNSVTVVRNITPIAKLSSPSFTSDSVVFDINTLGSPNYAVETSTNLSLPTGWTALTNISGATNVSHFVDTIRTNFPQRYYRVRLN